MSFNAKQNVNSPQLQLVFNLQATLSPNVAIFKLLHNTFSYPSLETQQSDLETVKIGYWINTIDTHLTGLIGFFGDIIDKKGP